MGSWGGHLLLSRLTFSIAFGQTRWADWQPRGCLLQTTLCIPGAIASASPGHLRTKGPSPNSPPRLPLSACPSQWRDLRSSFAPQRAKEGKLSDSSAPRVQQQSVCINGGQLPETAKLVPTRVHTGARQVPPLLQQGEGGPALPEPCELEESVGSFSPGTPSKLPPAACLGAQARGWEEAATSSHG